MRKEKEGGEGREGKREEMKKGIFAEGTILLYSLSISHSFKIRPMFEDNRLFFQVRNYQGRSWVTTERNCPKETKKD